MLKSKRYIRYTFIVTVLYYLVITLAISLTSYSCILASIINNYVRKDQRVSVIAQLYSTVITEPKEHLCTAFYGVNRTLSVCRNKKFFGT